MPRWGWCYMMGEGGKKEFYCRHFLLGTYAGIWAAAREPQT